MKPGIFFISGLLLINSLQLNAQGRTIQVPDIKVLKPGSNPIGTLDSIRFSVSVSNGKLAGLTAKSANGQNLPVFYRSTARIAQTGGTSIEEYCEACVKVTEPNGRIQLKCWEIDCDDVVRLKPSLTHPEMTIQFPKSPSTGSYTIFKDQSVELKATYANGQITKITGTSLKNETLTTETITFNEVSHARAKGDVVKCGIVIRRTLPDGSVITTQREVPCDKLPKPKNPTTN